MRATTREFGSLLAFCTITLPTDRSSSVRLAKVDSWSDWGGYVKGAEISILDILILAIYFSLPAVRDPLPFKISMSLYFLAVVLSRNSRGSLRTAALFYACLQRRIFPSVCCNNQGDIYRSTRRSCALPRWDGCWVRFCKLSFRYGSASVWTFCKLREHLARKTY